MNLLYTQTFEKVPQLGEKSSIEHRDNSVQKVSQVEKIFKPQHTVQLEGSVLPLNIFAILWGHHKAIIGRCEQESEKKAMFDNNMGVLVDPLPKDLGEIGIKGANRKNCYKYYHKLGTILCKQKYDEQTEKLVGFLYK